ncbi:MAG: DUF6220 domain-containing protein [Actinomycetota bacterium]
MRALRAVYRYWISIVTAVVVVQIGLAGYGAFYAADKVNNSTIDENTFEDGFGAHIGLGYLIFLLVVVAVILALIARPGKRFVLMTIGALVLVFVQIVLAQIGESVPAVGALHPINAFIILGLLGTLTVRLWLARKMGRGGSTAAPAPAPPG